MELKDYQTDVLTDLSNYLQTLTDCKFSLKKTFATYWQNRGVQDQKYKDNVLDVPHVCVKVPTAGGKTFIAVNALDRIFAFFSQYNASKPKVVLWLVPSITILEQTAKNLANIDHPYRQRLNDLFNGRVQIYEKADVLQGAGFSADTVREQLTVIVMTFDSLKATNKENRKAYQENGYLASFLTTTSNDSDLLPEYDKSSLINVIRTLNPVMVVDESHNAESTLSVEMLRTLNPSFIFDLTATPRENSNIISYVDALRLKKKNMVKLPVIVANQQSQEEVISAALNMRCQLEHLAKMTEEKGGNYIRPIILFQAEPKNKDDTTTFEKVKQQLIDKNIPPDQIAIKTANVNELKNVDLLNRDCPIRYIITINALKEGWDCPFAYILATLANKSSVVDVTQILGRVLRMPYTQKHSAELLNLSYVFTASSQFQDTLNHVVTALNAAGFSNRDYRHVDPAETLQAQDNPGQSPPQAHDIFTHNNDNNPSPGATQSNNPNWEAQAIAQASQTSAEVNGQTTQATDTVEHIKAQALHHAQAYEEQAAQADAESCPEELKAHMKQYKIKPMFKESAAAIKLPQFFLKLPTAGGFFEPEEEWQKLKEENLLKNFVLANLDATMDFAAVDADMYSIDVEDHGEGESEAAKKIMGKADKERINQAIKGQSLAGQIKTTVEILFGHMGKNTFRPIEDNDIKRYLQRIVEAMSTEQRHDCLIRDVAYAQTIKTKIKSLTNTFAAKEFNTWLDTQKITQRPAFSFPPTISPNDSAPAITKSLYVTEGKMNAWEERMMHNVANLENVTWWHRNLDRSKGFEINGAFNHYPDFIVLTARKTIVIIETKGGHLNNSDSKEKLKLGRTWTNQANQITHETGYRYHYMMVFDSNPIDGSQLIGDALKQIAEI